MQQIESNTERILNQTIGEILAVQENANDNLDEILCDYKKLFASDKIHPCVQKHIDEVKNVSANARDDALKCTETALKEIESSRENIAPYTESIQSLIKIINGVSEQCSRPSNHIAVALCVIENVC